MGGESGTRGFGSEGSECEGEGGEAGVIDILVHSMQEGDARTKD